MNDQTEVLPTPLQQESFDIVFRGYSRGQVDEYVQRIKRQLEDLGNRTTQAERQAEEARRDRDLVRSELSAANQKLERDAPSFEEFGERLTQILRSGQDEADEMRSNAEAEAQRIRVEAEESVQGLRQQVEEQHAAAETEAERLRTEGRDEAQRVSAEAEESARQVQREAEERAQQLISEAEERSSQRERAARERVEELEAQQAQLLTQLSDVRDSLQVMLPGKAAVVESTEESGEQSTEKSGEESTGESTGAGQGETPGGSDASTDGAARPDDTAVGSGAETTPFKRPGPG